MTQIWFLHEAEVLLSIGAHNHRIFQISTKLIWRKFKLNVPCRPSTLRWWLSWKIRLFIEHPKFIISTHELQLSLLYFAPTKTGSDLKWVDRSWREFPASEISFFMWNFIFIHFEISHWTNWRHPWIYMIFGTSLIEMRKLFIFNHLILKATVNEIMSSQSFDMTVKWMREYWLFWISCYLYWKIIITNIISS